MNKTFSLSEVSSTFGAAMIRTGLLSSSFLSAPNADKLEDAPLPTRSFEVIEVVETPSVASPFYFVDSLSAYSRRFDFESEMATFYQRLQSSQESLGSEFEKVLADNLWDLYTKS